MMGPRQTSQPKLFYTAFNLEARIPGDHPLRRIAAGVAFDFVRPLVKPLYGRNGHVSIDTVVVLKLLSLLFYENVASERALLARLPMRLDWLWFCGYDLDDALPDPSVLSKARRRWGQAIFEAFFQRVLAQCIEAGLVDGTVVHIDSSMIDGNAGKDRLQVYLRTVGAQVYDQLDRAERVDRDVSDEPSASGAGPGPQTITESPAASAAAEEPLGPGQRFTPVDPDARVGRKYGTTTLGYKDHRVVDDRSGVVTATVTTAANVNDETMLGTVIEDHESNTGSTVAVAAADKAYGTGENYRYLQEKGVTPCISHKGKNCNRDPDLSNKQFAYDPTTDTFRCPAGQTLKRRQLKKDHNAVIYQASREVCQTCIHFVRCVTSRTQGRRISRNLNEPYIEWADGCLSRTQRKRLMARRKAKAEGSFADAANNHGFKRARWRGLARVGIQNLLIAAVQNLRKLVRTLFGKRGKSTYASFSSARSSVRPDRGHFGVRPADQPGFSVRFESPTATTHRAEFIFGLAED